MSFAYIKRPLCSFILVLLCCCGALAGDPPVEVRVGFFPMHGFHEYDKAGTPIGYDVDYLRRVGSYTDWTFRYVRVDSWDDALEQLAAGKLDLVGSAQFTPERAARFEYSAYSNGTTYGAIIALSGNGNLRYEGFEDFNKARFGCVATYVRQEEFQKYTEKHGFAPEMVLFDSTEQMRKAMHAREIDAMVCSIMELGDNEKVVAEFAPAPFYYISTKNNVELLDTLNAAIARIKIDAPFFETRLMDAWYPVVRTPSFTSGEIAYATAHPELRVAQFIRRHPLAGTQNETESGTFTGIVPEIMELIGRESGLNIVSVPIPGGASPLELLKSGKADVVAGVVAFPDQLKDPSIRLTESFLTGRMIMLARRGEPFIAAMPLKAAVPSGYKAAEDFIRKSFPHFSIVYYPSTRACLNAVRNGEADVTSQNAYVVERFLQGPRYDELMVLPTISEVEKLVLALPADADPKLLSMLNKSILRLPKSVVDQIVINNTVAKPYVISFEDFLIQYRIELITGGTLLLLCGVVFAGYLRQRRKNSELIRENEETLRNITNNINGGVITLIADKGFTIVYANNGFLELVGYSRDQYEDELCQECITYVHPNDVQALNTAIAAKNRNGDTVAMELSILHKSGNYVPVMFRGTLSRNKDGQLILFCVVVDITEQRAMMEHLKIEKERYQIVVEQSNDIIFEVDMEQQTLLCSPKFKEKFGWQMDSSDISTDAPYPLQVHPDDARTFQEMVQGILLKERSLIRQLRIRKIDGEYLWCRLLVSCIRNEGRLVKLIGKIEDVDEMVRERLRLEEMSRTDALCGLYNKRAMRLSIERALKQADAAGMECALFFVDIDNFKAVNDNLGHPVGDQALRDVAAVLRALFRSDDIIGRYGGDEFCVFAAHIPEAMVKAKAAEINTRLRRTYRDDSGVHVDISASVGVARGPEDGSSYEVLVSKADRALYTAKSEGKDRFILFDHTYCLGPEPARE